LHSVFATQLARLRGKAKSAHKKKKSMQFDEKPLKLRKNKKNEQEAKKSSRH
jgi:hypothetical protein